MRIFVFSFLFCGIAAALTSDEVKLLQDPGGWEYQTISEASNGFQTQGVCFTEAYTGECRGTLLLHRDSTFRQDISAQGRGMHRGGRYQVEGDKLTFWDEHDTQDGPYTVSIDQEHKTMRLQILQAGVQINLDLMLESEFRKQMRERAAKK